jgi:tetratricopeptide (TPR) repeat protein
MFYFPHSGLSAKIDVCGEGSVKGAIVSSEQARELRQRGITAAKAGQNDLARQLLQQSIRLEPRNEAAWIWLASVAQDRRERLFCFQKLLEINPQNETALKALKAMGITPEQLQGQITPEAPPPAPSPVVSKRVTPIQSTAQPSQTSVQPQPVMTPGVPVPDQQRIVEAQQKVDEILRQYRLSSEKIENLHWTRKTKGRAGERDSLVLRLYVIGGIIGALLVIGIIGTVVVLNNPRLRGIVFAPTWTPTYTPSATPTNTPGYTPTPSPTPRLTLTPSPTVQPNIQRGDINAPPAPTRIYPPVTNRLISDSVALINQKAYAVALPTLEAERGLTENSFNPAPYYYEALALLGADNTTRALRVIEEAENRLSERPNEGFKPLVDLGYAQVYLKLAEDAFKTREATDAVNYLDQVELRAESAIAGDPRLADAYVLLAKNYELRSNYDDALDILNRGLENPELTSDVNLIVERGEVYFEQGEIDLAAQEAFLALYIDPTIERAYQLQIKIALAKDDPGLAVIYAQNYLFFYPGSVAGYKLLGDARVAEGNIDLALVAYDQALAAEEPTPDTVDVLVARANLYIQQRRYDQARLDLTRAFNLSDDIAIQAQRMQAAYLAGNFGVAQDDAETLLGIGILPDSEIQLLQARILIDEASPQDTEAFAQALILIDTARGSIRDDLVPIGNEYRARALYATGQFNDALVGIDSALAAIETGSRRFLRGEILEALEQPEAAIREYEWVLTWGEIYAYPFLPEVRDKLESVRDE